MQSLSYERQTSFQQKTLMIGKRSTMKTFFHKAFTCRLKAISMHPTSGQHGYSNPNPYAIFNATHYNDDTSTASTHHTMETTTVPTVGSTLGGTPMSSEVASALAQISQTQNALMQQMAALSVVPQQNPPQQITIPTVNQITHMEADSVARVAESVDHMVGADAVVEIEAEDVDHLLKRQPTYLRPVYRLLH
jgi:hypothetical protein